MGDSKALDRIRRLMAMANDATSPNEAAIAAKRARSLMDKHGVKMTDLEEGDGFGMARGMANQKFMPVWKQGMAIAVADFNDCIVVREADGLVFKGEANDAELAAAMFIDLCNAITNLCKAYMKREGYQRYNAKVGDAFKNGAYQEIRSRIKEALAERENDLKTEGGKSLVVVKKDLVMQHFKGEVRYVTKAKRSAADERAEKAKSAGRAAGRTVPISNRSDRVE